MYLHARIPAALASLLMLACMPDQGAAPLATTGDGPLLEARVAPPGEPVGVLGIVSVVLTPASAVIDVGTSLQLSATVTNYLGTVLPSPKLTWASSQPLVATVNSTGLVQGSQTGTTSIQATALNGTVGTATVTVQVPPPSTAETLVAAGDIAVCGVAYDEATAALIDGIPGTVAALGDLAYPSGTASDFANCYDPSWGRHKSRTAPTAGNHEYSTAGAAPYYTYFGTAAGDPAKGYYSYDLGDWHVVVLNSNCTYVSCAVGSPQETWLRADLAATAKPCLLAYWHHPRFSSDKTHGSSATVAPFWNALYAARADIVLNGHAHLYERFGLQNPSAIADAKGIRQFTVGTGGRSPLYSWGTIKANSQVRSNTAFGVLKLTLGSGTYAWDFVPVAGTSWTDSGSGACH